MLKGFALVGLLSTGLLAQNVTGLLTGIVSDPTGAVVPGATVVMANQQNGVERRTITNGDGFFSISGVLVGDYTVTISAKGFQQFKQANIHFDAGDTRTLPNITLTIGDSTQTVTVEASGEQLTPVDSGEKSIVIGQRQLEDIPIVGQNAAEFIKILPGFAMTGAGNGVNAGYNGQVQNTGAGPIGSFSANGLRTAALDITSDGAHTIDPGCNCGQAVNNVTDMTQEMKVLTSNFGADNAKGPVVISAISKSGGSHFHGEAYIYARNSVLDATNAFNNSEGTNALTGQKVAPKPDTHFYYPGFNIGGPVVIPGTRFNHNHDKLFFFFAYQYYAQTVQDLSHDVFNSVVPTTFERNGDFTTASLGQYFGFNPDGSVKQAQSSSLGPAASNATIGNNGMIPATQFNSVGMNIMKNLYPLPNVDPQLNNGYNYIYTLTHSDNLWQLRPRVDYNINETTKLWVQYNKQHDMNHDNSTLWWGTNPAVPYPEPLNQPNYSDSVSVNLTKVFSPTLTNEVLFTYTKLYVPFSFSDPSKINASNLGISYQHIFNNTVNNQIPAITGWSDGVANLIQPSGFETGTLYAEKWLPSLSDNLSKVWGTHTMKFGFYWERTKNAQPSDSYVNGELQYANWGQGSTGNAYADMLTGIISGGYAESNFDPLIAMHYSSASFYAQDDWKLSKRFTLDYGIRFDHLGPWVDEQGYGPAVFVPSAYDPTKPATSLTGFEWHKINPSIPLSGTPGRAFFYNPRVGFAWDVFGTGRTVMRGGFGMYRYHDEQNVQAGAMALPPGAYTYSVPNPSGGAPQTFNYIAQQTPSFVVPGSITVLDPKDTQQPLTKSYSFTISQRMPMTSTAEFSYVGNKATDLSNWNNNIGGLNNLPAGTLFTAANASYFGTASSFQNNPNVTALRPYNLYGTIHQEIHQLYSNYNAFQVSWNKQAGHGRWLANYTFSKSLGIRGEGGNGGVGDPVNFNNNYGVLPNDRTHILNLAYIYQEGAVVHNKVLGGVINNWMLSGITQFQSGTPLQVATGNSNFGLSGTTVVPYTLANGVVVPAGTGLQNALVTGSPDVSMQPILVCDPRSNLGPHQFMNGSCFAPPAPGQNGSFVFPYIKTPAFFDSDLSITKDFKISEFRKFQFRFSAYNFLNHPLVSFNPAGGDGNLTLSFDSAGKLAKPNFGYANYLNGNRSVQMDLKFYF
ncbi:MAG TPA: carboxypeptidase regulatory-like domain-containing protein [Bryobacteraceae bacterium]|nr:carboxypeptidase regulatory-like domain-containing protein [Bryobacteraceae bacterium]